MFEYNLSQGYQLAKLHQEQFVRERMAEGREHRLALEAMAGEKTLRKFRVMYRVRHWLHRIVPVLARGLF